VSAAVHSRRSARFVRGAGRKPAAANAAAVEKSAAPDIAEFAAAVADWRTQLASESTNQKATRRTPTLTLVENPIFSPPSRIRNPAGRALSSDCRRTDHVIANAKAKLAKKGCDWILANDVSPQTGVMGG